MGRPGGATPAYVPRGLLALPIVALLAGCGSILQPSSFADATPGMRPEAFFAGSTSSSGILANRSGEPTARFHVEGRGVFLADGTLQLVQRIVFDGKAPTERTWMLHRADAHHYQATLTDAAGPVEGEAYGNLFHLEYDMRDPPFGRMHQWLYLQPDGKTVVNEATVSLLGITVAHLSERITHDADPRE